MRPRNDPCWNTENLYIEGGNLDVLKVLRENNIVMRDASAANDNVLDNFEQIFRLYSPDTTCKVL